jgi:hypothetical protein
VAPLLALIRGTPPNLEQNEGPSRSHYILILAGTGDLPVAKRLGVSASIFLRARSIQAVTQSQGPTRCNEGTVARGVCWNHNKGVHSGPFSMMN